ncbi:MAG: Pr6Pr family membrane protein [Eubacteriaceae bacterium]|nr:Pr6Pr family membrane protein [Eubacteriaceae bacterium]
MQNSIILLISLVGLFSLFCYSGLIKGEFKKGMFLYYTNLSNLFVSIYFLMLFFYRTGILPQFRFLENSAVSFSVTMIITMTFLVFHFVLVPYGLKHNEILTEMNIKLGECVIFHYVIPIAVILYWFIYADKSYPGPEVSFLWLGVPFVYFIFIMLRARKGKQIDGTHSKYPYPFLDIDLIGKGKCMGNIFGLFIVFFALSYGIYYFS